MDGEQRRSNRKSSNSIAISTLAILTMAVLFFGGVATSQVFAQDSGASKETTTTAVTKENGGGASAAIVEEEEAAPQPSVLPAPTTTTTTTEKGDLNCGDIQERNFAVSKEDDANNFDGDNDGIGCESATQGTEQLTESEAVITIEVIEIFEENNPEVAAAVEAEGAEIASNVTTQNPEAGDEVQIIVEDLEQEVAQTDAAVAETLPAAVNETAVVKQVAEMAIVEQALENEGVDVNTEANATQAAAEVEITVEDIGVAAEQVAQEGTVEQEVTTTTTAAAAPVAPTKEGETTAPAVAVDVAVGEVAEEAAPEIAEQTGQDTETVRALLERALVLLG